MKITIYSTPACPHCVLAKDYLKQNDIEFEEKDVAKDLEAAQEMIEKTKQTGVPVIIVKNEDKEEIILGFDKEKIDKLILKKSK